MQTIMDYNQFETAAKNAGLLGQFSQWDLNLARQNPEAGMQILKYKQDYAGATTDEARAMASQGAESVRKQYGYSGGQTGGSFMLTGENTNGSSLYSFGDVQKRAQDSGVYMSEHDWKLAEQNPMAGMGLVTNKEAYANAATDAERLAANQANETIRRESGGYTAGADGSGYTPTPLSPNDYVAPSAPKYAGNRQGEVDGLWNQQKNYGDFSYDVEKPTFDSQYSGEMQRLLSEILNREDFSYDAASDPLYSQYKKQYLREGERASADALGAAAAATGGIPSSYAATAAAQAGNYYAAQLTDKIPELYQLAYNKYLNDAQMDQTNLRLLGDMDDRDYSRYMDDVNQWNKDRSFAYGVYGDKYNRLADLTETARSLEETDYSRYLDDVNQYNKDREFGYGQHTDEVNYQTKERDKALEGERYEKAYADGRDDIAFSHSVTLRELENAESNTKWQQGFAEKELSNSMSNAEWERLYNLALLQAEAGNTELLNTLGQMVGGENWKALDASVVQGTGGSGGSDGDGDAYIGVDYPTFNFEGDIRKTYPSGYIDGENADEDYAILVERYGEDQLEAAGVTKGTAPYKTYDEAVKYLTDNGKADVAHYISPRSEWEKHKGGHISYEKYLEATVKKLMGE